MHVATLILAPALVLVLLVVLVFLGRMVRAWIRGQSGERLAQVERRRIALNDTKARLLTELTDLEFEFQMGKLSEADFEDLRRWYEKQVVETLAKLDALDAEEAQARAEGQEVPA